MPRAWGQRSSFATKMYILFVGKLKGYRNNLVESFKALTETYLVPIQRVEKEQPTKLPHLMVFRNDGILIIGSIIQLRDDWSNLTEHKQGVGCMWLLANDSPRYSDILFLTGSQTFHQEQCEGQS
ncbi:hypothetical protein F4819DRAFT_453545 [Hypoxylon fuscum]|nr:hypothetical protein F4819DRAFT_453545 [Hypoxylon fuscum]